MSNEGENEAQETNEKFEAAEIIESNEQELTLEEHSSAQEYTRNEIHMAYIIDENNRAHDVPNKQQNYDAIKDNNIDISKDTSGEQILESPSTEIGD